MKFIPKGGMCANCTKLYKDCSNLPFKEYKTLSSHSEDLIIVKCGEYERNTNSNNSGNDIYLSPDRAGQF